MCTFKFFHLADFDPKSHQLEREQGVLLRVDVITENSQLTLWVLSLVYENVLSVGRVLRLVSASMPPPVLAIH